MFEILRPTGAEGAKWQLYVDSLEYYRRDIHYTPAYARVQSCLGDVYAAVGTYSGDIVLQPFMLRNDGNADIVSLYGFGGPVPSLKLSWARFDADFAEWRDQHSVLCEYGQLSPFLQIRQRDFIDGGFEITHLKDVVVVDLIRDGLLESFSRNRRRGIKEALARGVIVWPTTDWPRFAELYRQSMNRLNASDRWLYPNFIWRDYLNELGPDHCTLIKSFTYDGGVEGMLLVLHAYGRAYAHFLGTSTQASNDLLYYESMKYCKNAGAYIYHVGGGLTAKPDDPLLAYKAGFSEQRAPVYTYKRVFNEEAYDKACEGLPETTFFPAYRVSDVHSPAVH